MPHASVYVTCPDRDTARRLARELLERRLVACANLWPIESLYAWEGRLEEGAEFALLLKTRQDRVEEVVAEVARLHPYDVPCAVAFAWSGAHAPYGDWVDSELA